MSVFVTLACAGLFFLGIAFTVFGLGTALKHALLVKRTLNQTEMHTWLERNRHLDPDRFDRLIDSGDLIRQNFFRRDAHALQITIYSGLSVCALLSACYFASLGMKHISSVSPDATTTPVVRDSNQ